MEPIKKLEALLAKLERYKPKQEFDNAVAEGKVSEVLAKADNVFGAFEKKMVEAVAECRAYAASEQERTSKLERLQQENALQRGAIEDLTNQCGALIAKPARRIGLTVAASLLALAAGFAGGYYVSKRAPHAEQIVRPAIPQNGIYYLDALSKGVWKDAKEVSAPEQLAFYFSETGTGSMRIKFAPNLREDIETIFSRAQEIDIEAGRIRKPMTARQYARVASALAQASGTLDTITEKGITQAKKLTVEEGLSAVGIDYNKPPFSP